MPALLWLPLLPSVPEPPQRASLGREAGSSKLDSLSVVYISMLCMPWPRRARVQAGEMVLLWKQVLPNRKEPGWNQEGGHLHLGGRGALCHPGSI